jgi:biotin carboxyl carrier protein
MFKAIINDKVFILDGKDNKLVNGSDPDMDIIQTSKGKFHFLISGRSYTAEIISVDKETKSCIIKVGDKIIPVQIRDKYDELLQEIGIDETSGKKVNDIKAPMPGMVLKVMVENGQPIKRGDSIVVLEAMKMENILKSPADGIVKKIFVTKGDKVEKNQVMVNLD